MTRSKYVQTRSLSRARRFPLGSRWGKLVVTGFVQLEHFCHGKKYGRWVVECKCDCGGKIRAEQSNLFHGRTTHCGCEYTAPNKGQRTQRVETHLFYQYKVAAKQRGLQFSLTFEQFSTLIAQECYYCGDAPRIRRLTKYCEGAANGVDRIDNCLGYMPENCVPCCSICNRAKNEMIAAEFVKWAGRVTAHCALPRLALQQTSLATAIGDASRLGQSQRQECTSPQSP